MPVQPRYTGNPVSLDFQGADLRAVLRTFSEISGLNLVIDPTIQGTVDVALRDVPWDQALDIILRANKLGYVVDGTIVRIAPLTVLADEETQRRKLSDEQALAGELRVLTRSLSYARAEDLRAAAHADGAVAARIDPVRRAHEHAHHQRPARSPRARRRPAHDARSCRSRRSRSKRASSRRRVTSRGTSACSGAIGGARQRGARQHPAAGVPEPGCASAAGPGPRRDRDGDCVERVNLGVSPATSAIGLALGSVNGAVNLDVALSALERTGQGRILSTPRVSTQNNIEAEITQGIQIPIQTVANNTVTVSFRDAALTLQGHAADHGGQHGDHAHLGGERVARLQPRDQRHPADRHAARADAGAGQRRRDDGHRRHLRQPRAGNVRTGRRACTGIPLLGWLFKRNEFSGREPRAAHLHHAEDHEALGEK